MNEYCCALGSAVLKARKELGLTQDNIAEILDIDSRTILNIEHCEGNPKLQILYPLIRFLHLDPWTCFYPELEQNDPELARFHALLATCSNEELSALFSICNNVLSVLRAKDATPITEKEPASLAF